MVLITSSGSYIEVAAGDDLDVGGNHGRISSIRVAEFVDVHEARSQGVSSQFVNGLRNANIELEIMFFGISTNIQEVFAPYCTEFTLNRDTQFGSHFGIESINRNFDPMIQEATTTVNVSGFAERMADFLHATNGINGQTYVKDDIIQKVKQPSKKTKKATKITRNQSRWEALEL